MGHRFWDLVAHHVHSIKKELNNPCMASKEGRQLTNFLWQKPPMGYFKVNVDGSHHPSSGSSAIGGVIRRDSCSFVKGFYAKPSPCNALVAEMVALARGVQLARHLSLKKVIFELDSSVVVDFVIVGHTSIVPLQPMLEETLKLLRLADWEASIHLVSRDANKSADLLASTGHRAQFELCVIDAAFPLLDLLISDDYRGRSSSVVLA